MSAAEQAPLLTNESSNPTNSVPTQQPPPVGSTQNGSANSAATAAAAIAEASSNKNESTAAKKEEDRESLEDKLKRECHESMSRITLKQRSIIKQTWSMLYERHPTQFLNAFVMSIEMDEDITAQYKEFIMKALARATPELILRAYSQVIEYLDQNNFNDLYKLLFRIGQVHIQQEVDIKELNYVRKHLLKLLRRFVESGGSIEALSTHSVMAKSKVASSRAGNSSRKTTEIAFKKMTSLVQQCIASAFSIHALSTLTFPSPNDFALVRKHMEYLFNNRANVEHVLYRNLHQASSSMKKFFPSTDKLGSLLVGLNWLFQLTNDMNMLLEYIYGLGTTHVKMGIGSRHIKYVTQAWFQMLRQILEMQWNIDSGAAWRSVWNFLVVQLRNAMRNAELLGTNQYDPLNIKMAIRLSSLRSIDPSNYSFQCEFDYHACTHGSGETVNKIFKKHYLKAKENGGDFGTHIVMGLKEFKDKLVSQKLKRQQKKKKLANQQSEDDSKEREESDKKGEENDDDEEDEAEDEKGFAVSPFSIQLKNSTAVEQDVRVMTNVSGTNWYESGHVDGTFRHYFTTKYFPLDFLQLKLKFNLGVSSKIAKFDPDDVSVGFTPGASNSMGGAEWTILNPHLNLKVVSTDNESDDKMHQLEVILPVVRQSDSLLFYLLVPIIIVDLCSFQIYAFDHHDLYPRLESFIFLMIVLVVFQYIVISRLCPLACYSTWLDTQFKMSYLMNFIHGFISTLEILMGDVFSHMDIFFVSVLGTIYIGMRAYGLWDIWGLIQERNELLAVRNGFNMDSDGFRTTLNGSTLHSFSGTSVNSNNGGGKSSSMRGGSSHKSSTRKSSRKGGGGGGGSSKRGGKKKRRKNRDSDDSSSFNLDVSDSW